MAIKFRDEVPLNKLKSEAPERIWLEDLEENSHGCFNAYPNNELGGTEYVRADLAPAGEKCEWKATPVDDLVTLWATACGHERQMVYRVVEMKFCSFCGKKIK